MRVANKAQIFNEARGTGLIKIGEVTKLSGTSIETLRFYEKSGLLDRPHRTGSGYRLYDSEVLEGLAFIKRAQVLGFSLEEIKRIIAEKRAGQSPCAEVREIVRLRLEDLDERLAQMRRYRKELAQAPSEWEKAGDTEGHICGLIEGTTMHHPETAVARTLKRDASLKRKQKR